MNLIDHWKAEAAKKLSAVTETTIEGNELTIPPDPKLGDFAFGCFKLAKEQKTNPTELAQSIASKVTIEQSDFASVSAEGPYVNFTLSIPHCVHRVVEEIETSKEAFTESNSGEGKELVLEYAQPNTHKVIHVGHLRNFLIGAALDRVLTHVGWQVVPVSYFGDVGAHVAKCLWHLTKSRGFDISSFSLTDVEKLLATIPAEKKTGEYLGEIYAESTQKMDESPEGKEEVSFVLQKLEAHDPAWEKLWLETRRWSLNEMKEVFDELGVHFKKQYLESEVVTRGQELVDDLLEKGIAKKSEGAIIVDLEEKKLGVFLVRKSDGTSLYATKDLALAEEKLKDYPNAERSLILVDSRQSHYFKQLFATLGMMDVKPIPEFIGYEFVTLKSGAMSSREGNIVSYKELRDQVLAYARTEIEKRHVNEWSEGKITHTAWCIAMSGMKFSMLKQDNDKIFTFDLEQALSFEGATGPYCQYAATRLSSILKKAEQKIDSNSELPFSFDHEPEKRLALILAELPSKIETAAAELRPSVIGQWCLETAQRVNDFYRDVPVLKTEGEERVARMRLVAAAHTVLESGLALLGIPLPDEM